MPTKNKRSLNMSEQELQDMLSRNKNIKVASTTPMKSVEVLASKTLRVKKTKAKIKKAPLHDFFLNEKEPSEAETALKPKKKQLGINVKEKILEVNKSAVISTSHSKDHISLLFEGARLLSVNQIFSILQYRKFEIFAYKKLWQELVEKALSGMQDLPYFEKDCEIILLLQNQKLVDTDALSVMFKYIIDALKQDKKQPNKPAVLSEDNPKVVHNIRFIQSKGKENWVGIRLQRTVGVENSLDTSKFLQSKAI